MKKTYIKPETSICRLNAEHAILVVSNIPVNGGPTDAEQLSKQHSSGGVFWDSGDMYGTQSEYGGAVTSNYPDCLWDD